jgi:hypothetical protein
MSAKVDTRKQTTYSPYTKPTEFCHLDVAFSRGQHPLERLETCTDGHALKMANGDLAACGLTCTNDAIMVTLKINTPRGSKRFFPAGYLCRSPLCPIATFETKMIRVEMKSRKASTKEATSETEDDERTASPLARSRMMLTPKLTLSASEFLFSRFSSRSCDAGSKGSSSARSIGSRRSDRARLRLRSRLFPRFGFTSETDPEGFWTMITGALCPRPLCGKV